MPWFSEDYCRGTVSRQLPQRGLQARVVHRLLWLGAAQMGSFEAILLIASSSAALFWLAVRMVDGEAEEEAEAVTRKEAADAED